MSNLEEKIYSMHGKIESLATEFKNMNDKLDMALNPKRKCNSLRKIELIGTIVIVLFIISLTNSPGISIILKLLKVTF